MSISTAAFERIGIHVPPAVLERLIVAAIEQMLPERRIQEPRYELTPDEAAALGRGGLRLEPIQAGVEDPLVRSAAEYAALIASSLAVSQVAGRLGVDDSRVRQRLAARSLYGIKVSSVWRIPIFQLVGDRLVPGIERVLPHLDPGLHPLTVLRWFTSPQVDLFLDEQETPVAPLEWLRAGGDPGRLVELARGLSTGD